MAGSGRSMNASMGASQQIGAKTSGNYAKDKDCFFFLDQTTQAYRFKHQVEKGQYRIPFIF